MDHEPQMQQVEQTINTWLAALDQMPAMLQLTATQLHDVHAIVDSFSQITLGGYQRKPATWDDQLVADVMFSRFVLVLEDDEKTAKLYQMIPQALKSLFSYLGKQGLLPNAQHLIDWVNINARGLQDLSNPQLDQFYRDLVAAMRREGVIFSDRAAVQSFTQQYLEQHPQAGIKLDQE
ncbi:hypothetical protein [Fructilactobacillus florum]|uniref:hypothetical protein n=1 Tax=Fructilactobacillus florum TaxID=640331 RepID=UPI00028EC0A0|nr:hypothetical protein [Fructilactobacillus florum]EKK21059.1 hypothetical protein B807_229 [Fructilactobacillus florum 2F]